ncbi:MAG: DUF1015 domain-containing protein [Pirellulales bacterium]|nr:DUF1015 domain-containing protein [Pirellulales bacterium]
MADISAFRGIRYDLGHIGSLANVTAPPYDVIDSGYQNILYKRHPANVVRLILNREEIGDDDQVNRYTRAARFLRNWLREGVLFREADPAVYVYHQTFSKEGYRDASHERPQEEDGKFLSGTGAHATLDTPLSPWTRRGFVARVRLERFGEGNIYPHEETHPKAKADRLRLWQACQANLSPIFGIYPDENNMAQEILETAIRGQTPIEVTDDDGTCHRLWPVTDVAVISALIGAMGGKPVYIADGHHRYETAIAYRDALATKMASHAPRGKQVSASTHDSGHPGNPIQDLQMLPPDHPANYVLMNCVSMNDPGLVVLPTHRLFRGLPPITAVQLAERLGACFHVSFWTTPPGRSVGTPLETGDTARDTVQIDYESALQDARSVWSLVENATSQGRLAFYTAADQQWILADITDTGHRRLAEVAPEKSAAWRSLGVSILHRLVIDTLLDASTIPTPKYVRSIEDLVSSLIHGDDTGRDATGQQGSGGHFELAAFVMPASVEHIRAISNEGERMPAKSTFFFPKVLSGLVINPLTP